MKGLENGEIIVDYPGEPSVTTMVLQEGGRSFRVREGEVIREAEDRQSKKEI